MRLTFPLAFVLLLPACGDNGGGETSNTPTTTPSSTDPGTGTTAPTTGTTASTGDPVTTTSESATGSATSSTTDPATGSTTTPVDPSSTGEPATGSTTDTSSSTTGDDTGPMPGGACVTDKDCALHNDCCDCFGIKAGDPDPICKKQCDQATCDALGIDQAVCRFGVCGTERINCDNSKVTCKIQQPDCAPGEVPGINANGDCWTGLCVPALSCDVVPDCSDCPGDSICVQKISKQQTLPTCEPIPLECDSKVDCQCAGSFVCTGIFTACNELGDNDLSCGCPQC